MELSHKEYGIVEYLARNIGYPKSKIEISFSENYYYIRNQHIFSAGLILKFSKNL